MILKYVDENLRRLYRYFLPHKAKLALATVFLVCSASMSSVTATLLGKITDASFYNQEEWVIYGAPLALIGVTLGFAISTVMSTYLMANVSQAVLVTIRTSMFERILHWPEAQYQNNTTGRICSKFVNEATIALSGAAQSFIVLVRDSIQVVALLGVLFWHDWQLTLVTFVIIPGLALTLRTISRRVRRIVADSQETLGSMISRVQESFDAQHIIKVSDTYAFEEQRFATVNNRIRHLSLKLIKMQSITTPITQLLTMVAIACVVGIALFEAQKGLLTIGEFITFLSALLLIKAPIQHLSGLNGTFASISVAVRSIFETLDAPEEVDDGCQTLSGTKGELIFENVTLRYPEQVLPALSDVSLTIHPGEHIAVVGPSGSGKTSLVNLLPRFLETTSGRILLDGIDIRDLTLENLRSHFSFVTQDVVLFDDTIRNNLIYGLENISDEAIDQAVEHTALSDFIRSLPDGLNTKVGENGSLLSGGQKQRISIARAFLKDAPILIMDEATSALDSESEAQIKKAMEKLTKNRTAIIVAHRFSTIDNVDRIACFANGSLVEIGSRQALQANNGLFAQLLRLQSGI